MNQSFRRDAMLLAAGAAVFGLIGAAVLLLRVDPDEASASRAKRLAAVAAIEIDLVASAEAQKSAVLSVSDEGAARFAGEARARTGDLERRLHDIEALLAAGGTSEERGSLADFARTFAEYRRVDDELLQLAGRNTNLKATALLLGPVADAVGDLDAALDRVVSAAASGPAAPETAARASAVRIAALRVETLLPPHIAEESAAKMSELEARMAKATARTDDDLAALATLAQDRGAADVAAAVSARARLTELSTRIVSLSRENTNVRAVALCLNETRNALTACTAALAALRQSVEAEPTGREPASPR